MASMKVKNIFPLNRSPRPNSITDTFLYTGVPDYPPPSFQEAISGSLAPSNTPTQSSSPASLEVSSHHSTDHQTHIPGSERSITQNSLSDSPSPSESEDSLEIIENTHPNELSIDRASRMESNQGITFPTPSLSSAAANISIDSQLGSGPSRGRPSAKWSSKNDLTADDSEEEPRISPVRSTTKRFLSLSPLRTLFPAKHLSPQDRAYSAHPVPESSPYSAPANANCYRSTTSLTSSTVFRLPFGHSTLTLATPKPESVKSSSKRLFRSKTREKEKEKKGKKKREFDEESDESWDTWELLERQPESGEIRRVEPEPRSLSAMKMPPADISSPVISPEDSSTRSLSCSNEGPPTPVPQSPEPSNLEPTEPSTPSWNEPHVLSLRDRKVAEAIEPFLRRRPKKAGPQRTKTTPNPIVIPSSPLGPQVTTVRSRLNPAYDSNNEPATDANGHGSWEEWSNETVTMSESDISSVVDESTHDLHRAYETLPPSGPLQLILSPHSAENTSIRRSSSPLSTNISISSPTTPVPARSALFPDGGRGFYSQPSPDEAPNIPETFSTPSQTPRYTGCIPKVKITSLPSHHSSTPSNPNSGYTTSPSPQNGRHHYVGRPLPRPPQAPSDAIVDSSYAGNISYAPSSPDYSNTSIPEGQLIDFENEAYEELSGSWTSPEVSASMTPRQLSPVTSSRNNTPDQSVRSMNTSGNASSISGLSGMTDLDLLAAALTDSSGRADYEVSGDFDINPFLRNG